MRDWLNPHVRGIGPSLGLDHRSPTLPLAEAAIADKSQVNLLERRRRIY
jgi:hypothetical protein